MVEHVNTTNDVQVATKEQIGSDVVKIRLQESVDPNSVIDELHGLFDDVLKDGASQVVFDMGNVEFPNGSFIAMLIGRTMEARRQGRDIKIINLSETARNHFAIFTPLTYLSIGTDEVVTPEEYIVAYPSSMEELVDFEQGKPSSLRVKASVDSLNVITQFVTTLAQKTGMEKIELSKLKIAVYEACMNVIEHGYRFEPGKFMEIEVLWERDRFQVTIVDKGDSFDFYDVKPYDVKEAFHEKRQGGFGLYIIQKSVDEIKYETDHEGENRLTLIKKIK